MNLFISIFALAISPFRELNPIKYQLEAIKWSLKASNYFGFRDTLPLEGIIERIISMERPKKQLKTRIFFERFLELRKTPSNNDLYFMIRSPTRILKLHGKAIVYRKLLENKFSILRSNSKNKAVLYRTFPISY